MAFSFGSGINAGLGRVDFSEIAQGGRSTAQGIANTGNIKAQSYAALGQGIGQGIQQYQQKQAEKKKKEEAISAFSNLVKSNPQIGKAWGVTMDAEGNPDAKELGAAVQSVGPEGLINFARDFEQRKAQADAQEKAAMLQGGVSAYVNSNGQMPNGFSQELAAEVMFKGNQILRDQQQQIAQTGSLNRANVNAAPSELQNAKTLAEIAAINAGVEKTKTETKGLQKSLTEDKKAAEFGWEWSEDGTELRVVKGGPQDIKNRDASSQAALDRQMRAYSLDESLSNIDNVMVELDKALGIPDLDAQGNPTGKRRGGVLNEGGTGFSTWLKWIPMTDAKELASIFTTIKANIGFDRLQRMRELSKTGGALGQVAVQELEALQASIASLDQGMKEEQLRVNLMQILNRYNSIRQNFSAQREALQTKQPDYSASDALTGFSAK
jgi:hypothetical protein